MSRSTLTLTQSGLLAALLEHQHRKVIQLARRRASHNDLRAVFWSTLTWPWRALMAKTPFYDSAKPLVRIVPARHLVLSSKPIAVSHEVRAYPAQRKQIHDDLRIQHPEWVEPDGESSMRLMELLDALTRTDESETREFLNEEERKAAELCFNDCGEPGIKRGLTQPVFMN